MKITYEVKNEKQDIYDIKEKTMKGNIIDFLRRKFPKKWYSVKELQSEFCVSRDTIYYWLEKFEVPTFKINNSPFIVQENLINFLLKSNRESYSENRLVGFEFILEDIEEYKRVREKIEKESPPRQQVGRSWK